MNINAAAFKAKQDIFLISTGIGEGRDPQRIDQIARAVDELPGISLIEVDPNRNLDRTQLIFGGAREDIIRAGEVLVEAVFRNIDLREKTAEYRWLGAIDTLSFIPLHSSGLPVAIRMARSFARQIAEKFDVPIYLFSMAARKKTRQPLSAFRQFSYTRLPEKLSTKRWQPDFGSARVNQKFGALLVGARLFHLNVAIYFDTTDINLIEELIRVYEEMNGTLSADSAPRFDSTRISRFNEISKILNKIHAVVGDCPERKMVRVICNIPDYIETPLHIIYDGFLMEAAQVGIVVLGMEIFGYIPAEVLIHAGEYYAPQSRDERTEAKSDELIERAINKLKLNFAEPFNPQRQILDYRLTKIVNQHGTD